jgi:site-specific recombinase XerD
MNAQQLEKRNSLGVALVETNVNLAVIKQALGHKSIASTSVYTQPTDEIAGKAVKRALASMFQAYLSSKAVLSPRRTAQPYGFRVNS